MSKDKEWEYSDFEKTLNRLDKEKPSDSEPKVFATDEGVKEFIKQIEENQKKIVFKEVFEDGTVGYTVHNPEWNKITEDELNKYWDIDDEGYYVRNNTPAPKVRFESVGFWMPNGTTVEYKNISDE